MYFLMNLLLMNIYMKEIQLEVKNRVTNQVRLKLHHGSVQQMIFSCQNLKRINVIIDFSMTINLNKK